MGSKIFVYFSPIILALNLLIFWWNLILEKNEEIWNFESWEIFELSARKSSNREIEINTPRQLHTDSILFVESSQVGAEQIEQKQRLIKYTSICLKDLYNCILTKPIRVSQKFGLGWNLGKPHKIHP